MTMLWSGQTDSLRQAMLHMVSGSTCKGGWNGLATWSFWNDLMIKHFHFDSGSLHFTPLGHKWIWITPQLQWIWMKIQWHMIRNIHINTLREKIYQQAAKILYISICFFRRLIFGHPVHVSSDFLCFYVKIRREEVKCTRIVNIVFQETFSHTQLHQTTTFCM